MNSNRITSLFIAKLRTDTNRNVYTTPMVESLIDCADKSASGLVLHCTLQHVTLSRLLAHLSLFIVTSPSCHDSEKLWYVHITGIADLNASS